MKPHEEYRGNVLQMKRVPWFYNVLLLYINIWKDKYTYETVTKERIGLNMGGIYFHNAIEENAWKNDLRSSANSKIGIL